MNNRAVGGGRGGFRGRLCAAALAVTLAADADGGMGLAALLTLAEQTHSEFLAEKSRFAMAAEAAPAARAALLPQVAASWSQAGGGGMGNDGWTAGVEVSQALLDMPRRRLVRAAEAGVAEAEWGLAAARQNLRRDVVVAWLDLHQAAAALRLVETRRRTLSAQLGRAEALVAAGQAIDADVLSARAGLANARAQWEQARHNLAAAREAVRVRTGAAPVAMRLVGDVEELVPAPLEEWLRRAEEDNLRVRAARAAAAGVRYRLRAAADVVYPQLSLVGSAVTGEGLDEVEGRWSLSLRQSLFTGGELSSERRRLVAESDLAHESVAAVLEGNAETLRRLHGQMLADRARLTALSEAAEAAEALLEVIIVGYENGVNITAEVLGAEEEVFEARLNWQTAAYGYLKNWAAAQALVAGVDAEFAARVENLFADVAGG